MTTATIPCSRSKTSAQRRGRLHGRPRASIRSSAHSTRSTRNGCHARRRSSRSSPISGRAGPRFEGNRRDSSGWASPPVIGSRRTSTPLRTRPGPHAWMATPCSIWMFGATTCVSGVAWPLLLDWNMACRGNPAVDVAAWLPSLADEGGPMPWELLPGEGALASLVAGYFCARAGLSPIAQAPHARPLQLAQGRIALPWAARELDLPPPA